MEKIKNFVQNKPEIACLVILGIFCLIFLFAGLNSYPLVDVDETRYAVMSRGLIGSGDWSILMLNGVPFTEKPPLYFWLTAFSIKYLGFNEFAVRFPTALLATFCTFFTYYVGKTIISRKFGMYSALILLSTVFFLMLSHVAILDMTFTVFLTSAIYCGLLTSFCKDEHKKLYWLGFYVSMGLAFLAKGLLAFVIPVGVIGLYRLITRDVKEIFRPVNIIPGIIVFLAIILPWHIHMYQVYGYRFIYDYFILHHFERLVNAAELGKTRPFLYFVPVFLVGFLPWSVPFVIFLVKKAKRLFRRIYTKTLVYTFDSNESKLMLFAAIYFVLVFMLFSVASGKLPTYILPAFPAASMLTALFFLKKPMDYFNASIIVALLANFIMVGIVFDKIYSGGMDELVEYAEMAQEDNKKLVTFDMPVKPSVLINYREKVDFITRRDFEALDEKLDFDNDCYVIMKNSHIKNDAYKNELMKHLIKIKEGDKYTIYAEP